MSHLDTLFLYYFGIVNHAATLIFMLTNLRFLGLLALFLTGVFVGKVMPKSPVRAHVDKVARSSSSPIPFHENELEPNAETKAVHGSIQGSGRGPASAPTQPGTEPMGLFEPEKFLELKVKTENSKRNWYAKFVDKHFITPRDKNLSRGNGGASAYIGERLRLKSAQWIAEFPVVIAGSKYLMTVLLEPSSWQPRNEEGLDTISCSELSIALSQEGKTVLFWSRDCDLPARREKTFFVYVDALYEPTLLDYFAAAMIPLPEQSAPAYFLLTKTLRWSVTGEVPWFPISPERYQETLERISSGRN